MAMIDLLSLLIDGRRLTTEQATDAFLSIMNGECSEVEIASFLTALRVRGETPEELYAAAQVMRQKSQQPTTRLPGLLDTCGTGGDGAQTFNISTATAFVVAGCGVPVAKHGNRGVSSTSGSADVLSELGVNVNLGPDAVSDCLAETGLAFYFAPLWHPAMKHVMPVRKQLRFRTIFNFLGPLCNPAGADYQLVGVGAAIWAERIAETLARLGTKRAIVVRGADGLDEVTLAAETTAIVVENGRQTTVNWSHDSFGLPGGSCSSWRVESPAESARVVRGVLEGYPGPCRDIVLANAAAALYAANRVSDVREGAGLAARSVDSGAANDKLKELVRRTTQC